MHDWRAEAMVVARSYLPLSSETETGHDAAPAGAGVGDTAPFGGS